MTLSPLPAPNFTGADLSVRVNAALAEVRAARRFATVAAMLSDAAMAYGSGARAVAAGDVVEAGGHRYEVAAAGSPLSGAGHHLATAGGVLLRVLPGPDGIHNFAAMAPAANGVTDDYPKLRLLLDAVLTGTGWYRSGPAIFFPNGRYHMAQTIELKSAVRLMGNSSGLPSDSGPELVFPTNTTGIIVHRYNTTGSTTEGTPTTAADSTIIEGLRLSSTVGADKTKHGIWLRARAVVRNCRIGGFSGSGIQILAVAGGTAAQEGNANCWRLDTLRLDGNGGHGLYVAGADANAGTAIGVDATGNGRSGIYDSSFLGNLYMGCHTDSNGMAGAGGNPADQSSVVSFGGNRYAAHPSATEAQLVATQPGTNAAIWFPMGAGGVHPNIPLWTAGKPEGTYFKGYAYHSDNLNACNVFLGCYQESGAAGCAFEGPAIVLGGALTSVIRGDRLRATSNGRLTVNNITANAGALTSILGDPTGSNDIMAWGHSGETWNWALNRSGGDYVFRNANSDSRIALRITGEQTAQQMGTGAGVPYVATMPTMGLGWGTTLRRQTTGTAAPTTGAWAQGDIVWNVGASAGGFAGWICTAAGTPGTWKTFGAISA